MNITDIRIRRTYQDTRLRAVVSVTIDHDLAIHDIKVIEGPQRLFVAMPSRKDDNGTFRDIAHPITPQARRILEDSVLEAYQAYLQENELFSQGGQTGDFPQSRETPPAEPFGNMTASVSYPPSFH